MSAGNTRAGNQSPGGALRSAPYQKTFAAGAASSTDMTNQITQARCATSGLFCKATDTTVQLTWKDAAGNVNDTGSQTAVVGDVWDLPFAVTELTANTGLLVVAYWHGG